MAGVLLSLAYYEGQFSSLLDRRNVFARAYSSSLQFCSQLSKHFLDASTIFSKAFYEGKGLKDPTEIEKAAIAKAREVLEKRFREESFVKLLSESVDNYAKLAKVTGFGQFYQNTSNIVSMWNTAFVEPLRDAVWRTPSHKIHSEEKFSLFHYDRTTEKQDTTLPKTPILVVYAFINRHYILDLLPRVSIIRNLLGQGFDIFATDWGTPSGYDKDLTLGHFINNYLENSVDQIRKHTGSEKVSLLGYCWGGDLALMYAALHPEKVKNIVTLAAPGDFHADDGLLSVWTRSINTDFVVDVFGNIPSAMLNAAFALRSPIDYLHKYPHFFEKPRDFDSIIEFFATEMWLYDSPPVIGEIYRQFVKDCYQKNLLIKNKMTIGDNMFVDLGNVKMPFLNVLATKDDLVAPASSRALNEAVGSTDKKLIEFQSGHVGACISPKAHAELWPSVGSWLKDRS